MSITDTLLRRPTTKLAVAAAAVAALAGGGVYGAQAASAGADATPSVVRADAPKGDDNGGRIIAAEKPGNDWRPAPAPAVERADKPNGSTAGLEPAEKPAANDGSDARSR